MWSFCLWVVNRLDKKNGRKKEKRMVKLHSDQQGLQWWLFMYKVPGLSWILCTSRVKIELKLNDSWYFFPDVHKTKLWTYNSYIVKSTNVLWFSMRREMHRGCFLFLSDRHPKYQSTNVSCIRCSLSGKHEVIFCVFSFPTVKQKF